MPPEQIRGEGSLDARADVYALGVILYECLSGVRPFDAETLAHLAILIHTGQPKPIAELRPDLPPGFAQLVASAMATDRGRRMHSADELRSALEQFGPVGFRSQIRNSPLPPPSMVPARSISPPAASHGLSTSAAGVSLRQPAAAKSPAPVIAIAATLGLVALAAAGGGLWWYRSHSSALEITSAAPLAPSVGFAGPPGEARRAAPPSVTHEPPSPPVVPPAASPSVAPALTDPAPPAPSAARAAQSTVGSAAPRVPTRPLGRADERGLAKDNPFK
jgi:serine/threonine-protein kinase